MITILIPKKNISYRYIRVLNALKELEIPFKVIYLDKKFLYFYLIKQIIKNPKWDLRKSIKSNIREMIIDFLEKETGKILIQFQDSGGIFIKLLKNRLEKNNKFYINISHSISGKTKYFNQLNFSYYCVFGKKSVMNLRNNPHTCGEAKIILLGSLFYDKRLLKLKKQINYLKYKDKNKISLLFTSSWINKNEKWGRKLLENFKIIKELIKMKNNTRLVIKLHPLENHKYWYSLSEKLNLKNIVIYEGNISFYEILSKESIDIHLTSWSNSIIEMSLCNIPTIIVGDNREFDDYELHKYFPVAKNSQELCKLIDDVYDNKNKYIKNCNQFLDDVLVNIGREEDVLKDVIIKLLNNKEPNYCCVIKGKCAE